MIPDPLQRLAGVLLLFLGLGFALPSLVWMLVPLRGPRPPVVRFEPTRMVIRGSVVPTAIVVDRDAIRSVHVAHIQRWGQHLGLWPMVIVRTKDGRGRGVQNIYDGDPEELARDIARWASVPLTEPRRMLLGDEEFTGWDR